MEPSHTPASCKILVVEDEYLLAMQMRKLLREGGYEVIGPVASVAAALSVLGNARPDACVLDVNLRGEHSAPVARLLKELKVPFVLNTAYQQEMLVDEAFGGVTNIGKLASERQLLVALAALLQK